MIAAAGPEPIPFRYVSAGTSNDVTASRGVMSPETQKAGLKTRPTSRRV